MALLMSGTRVSSLADNSEQVNEALDENPWDFSPNNGYVLAKPRAMEAFKPLHITGRIEIHLGLLKLVPISTITPKQGETLRFSLVAKRSVPHAKGFGAATVGLIQFLSIRTVFNHAGKELVIDRRML